MGERRRGGQRQAHKGRVDPPRRAARGAGLRCPREVDPAGLRRSDLRVCRRGGRFPVPLTQPPARGAAKERSLGSRGLRAEAAAAQRPNASRAALATVGMSTRGGRELASITADLPQPPCWEETTRHAAAERLQRRKRRQRQALPAQSGRGAGRQGAEGGGRSGPSRSATAAWRGLAASRVRLPGGVGRGGRPAALRPAPGSWGGSTAGTEAPIPQLLPGSGTPGCDAPASPF